eukprot:TRINITY_DN7467_c0_g1_i1.p1 TRINITY_DN7467_c0_g1~~TRINITY_DN7467_c0_g1_i1.p1  ORF type:complete len:237 (+),score=44.75 TRINITY_DN7467_c0_g1_i1:84-794(+)
MESNSEQLKSEGTTQESPEESSTLSSKTSDYYREYRILIEYKHLPQHIPGGVYAVPSSDSIFDWKCVIFLRQSLYRGGVFKFSIQIPSKYPEEVPQVVFETPMFHPQIDKKGFLNVNRQFPKWDQNKFFLWHILAFVKKSFYQIDLQNPLNNEAADLFATNKQEFTSKVENCVSSSLQSVYVNPDNSNLQFSDWKEEFETTRKAILNKGFEGKDVVGSSWMSSVSSGFSKILSIKY